MIQATISQGEPLREVNEEYPRAHERRWRTWTRIVEGPDTWYAEASESDTGYIESLEEWGQRLRQWADICVTRNLDVPVAWMKTLWQEVDTRTQQDLCTHNATCHKTFRAWAHALLAMRSLPCTLEATGAFLSLFQVNGEQGQTRSHGGQKEHLAQERHRVRDHSVNPHSTVEQSFAMQASAWCTLMRWGRRLIVTQAPQDVWALWGELFEPWVGRMETALGWESAQTYSAFLKEYLHKENPFEQIHERASSRNEERFENALRHYMPLELLGGDSTASDMWLWVMRAALQKEWARTHTNPALQRLYAKNLLLDTILKGATPITPSNTLVQCMEELHTTLSHASRRDAKHTLATEVLHHSEALAPLLAWFGALRHVGQRQAFIQELWETFLAEKNLSEPNNRYGYSATGSTKLLHLAVLFTLFMPEQRQQEAKKEFLFGLMTLQPGAGHFPDEDVMRIALELLPSSWREAAWKSFAENARLHATPFFQALEDLRRRETQHLLRDTLQNTETVDEVESTRQTPLTARGVRQRC